ncbi:MAG: energy transducer TonB [Chitinophagales bacterium]|nr:energy transducer TonB [Chitinophagales bacterium]
MTKKSKKAESFIRTPGYPGGSAAMRKFIEKNLKYPKEALENNIQGKVRVKFKLNQNGKVTSALVEKGIGHGCDEEALRLVKLLNFKAVKNRGVKATFEKTISIPFYFKRKPTAEKKIVYQLIESSKAEEKNTYTYTISINKQ